MLTAILLSAVLNQTPTPEPEPEPMLCESKAVAEAIKVNVQALKDAGFVISDQAKRILYQRRFDKNGNIEAECYVEVTYQ